MKVLQYAVPSFIAPSAIPRPRHLPRTSYPALRRIQPTPNPTSPPHSSIRASSTLSPTHRDEDHMRHALLEARQAFAQSEVPIGAVLVSASGTVLSTGRNAVESEHDVTQHAELVALRRATRAANNWRLHGATLYCTLEPCPMCLSALALARVSAVVYAAPDLRLGACGTWVDLSRADHPFHTFDHVRGGVLEDEAAHLMREFFRRRREEGARSDAVS